MTVILSDRALPRRTRPADPVRRPVRRISPGLASLLAVLSLVVAACSTSESAESDCCRVTLISFEDVMPAGARVGLSWHGIGIDHRGRVYVGPEGRAVEADFILNGELL